MIGTSPGAAVVRARLGPDSIGNPVIVFTWLHGWFSGQGETDDEAEGSAVYFMTTFLPETHPVPPAKSDVAKLQFAEREQRRTAILRETP